MTPENASLISQVPSAVAHAKSILLNHGSLVWALTLLFWNGDENEMRDIEMVAGAFELA